jgi:hypothetical protein
MWINYAAQLFGICTVAGFPLLVTLPCLCCVPRARRRLLTLGLGWAFAYGFCMTLGPRQTAHWIAWIFSELWLAYAIKASGVAVFYSVKGVGILLSSVVQIAFLTLVIWAGWNVRRWYLAQRLRGQQQQQTED